MEKRIKAIFPGVKFNNTICEPTKIKQKEAKTLPVQNDVIIVIGSRTSANTKRLYQISKNLNPRTYWINSKEEIDPKWFAGAEKTGITAGASTPKETIEDIVSFLESLNIK